MAQRFPVHPITRIGVGLAGGLLGVIPGAVVAAVLDADVFALVACCVGGITGLARGASVTVWTNEGELRFRNLWRTYGIPAERIVRLDELRGQGMLKATNPALVVKGRRFRLPIHAAMLWGGLANPDWTDGDRRRARLLREWADLNKVSVAGVVKEMTPTDAFAKRGKLLGGWRSRRGP